VHYLSENKECGECEL